MAATTNLLELAQKTVAEINATVRSSHQITDRIELTALKLDKLSTLIGATIPTEAAISLAYWGIERQKCFDAVLSVDARLNQGDDTIKSLATARFGVGECGEMTCLALTKVYEYCPALMVVIGNKNKPELKEINHTCIILTESSDELRALVRKTSETFKGTLIPLKSFLKLANPQSILIDPFLKVACPIGELDTQGIDFKRYTQAYNLEHILDLVGIERNSARLKEGIQIADKIYRLAQEHIKEIPEKGLYFDFLREIAQESKNFLQTLAPDLEWKSNIKQSVKIFCTCSSERANLLSDQLMEKQIYHKKSKIKNSDNYCIVVENPDVSKFRLMKT